MGLGNRQWFQTAKTTKKKKKKHTHKKTSYVSGASAVVELLADVLSTLAE